MSPHEVTNMAASVHQRLKNHSASAGRLFNEVLVTYAIERFLYRLSVSPGGRLFVLKGGLMLMVWKSAVYRPTRDIDLLGHLPNAPTAIVQGARTIELPATVDHSTSLLYVAQELAAGRLP